MAPCRQSRLYALLITLDHDSRQPHVPHLADAVPADSAPFSAKVICSVSIIRGRDDTSELETWDRFRKSIEIIELEALTN